MSHVHPLPPHTRHTHTQAVAVSGGTDSLALTYLATKTFDRVVGITIDNRYSAVIYVNV